MNLLARIVGFLALAAALTAQTTPIYNASLSGNVTFTPMSVLNFQAGASGAVPIANGGVPSGGAINQVLTKTSSSNYVYAWVNPGTGGNVTGPGSAVAGDISTFNGTSGILLQDSGINVASGVVSGGKQISLTRSDGGYEVVLVDSRGGGITYEIATNAGLKIYDLTDLLNVLEFAPATGQPTFPFFGTAGPVSTDSSGNLSSQATLPVNQGGTGAAVVGPGLMFGNPFSGSNPPVFTTLSGFLDNAFGSSQGTVLYRGTSVWAGLAPGTSGYYLQSQGSMANPQWHSVSASAGGSSGQVQYNSSGSLGGNSGFTVDGSGNVSTLTLTSTVSTGTAPFVVSSTTNIPNLNASSLNGYTFANPAAIGSGTPAAGNFTSLGATGAVTTGAPSGGTAAAWKFGVFGTGNEQIDIAGTAYLVPGFTSYTKGDIIYSSADGSLAKLGIGSTGQVLVVASGIPSWGAGAVSTTGSPANTYLTYFTASGTISGNSNATSDTSGNLTANTLALNGDTGTWSPTLNSWSNVGSPTVTGKYVVIGNLVFVTLKIIPATSVSCTAGASNVSGLPFSPGSNLSTCVWVDAITTLGQGTGLLNADFWCPTISATSDTIVASGVYQK